MAKPYKEFKIFLTFNTPVDRNKINTLLEAAYHFLQLFGIQLSSWDVEEIGRDQ